MSRVRPVPEPYERVAIEIMTLGRNVRIICWNCRKKLWVRKGSVAHRAGLCDKCLLNGTPDVIKGGKTEYGN